MPTPPCGAARIGILSWGKVSIPVNMKACHGGTGFVSVRHVAVTHDGSLVVCSAAGLPGLGRRRARPPDPGAREVPCPRRNQSAAAGGRAGIITVCRARRGPRQAVAEGSKSR
jgi:hypothetical protein